MSLRKAVLLALALGASPSQAEPGGTGGPQVSELQTFLDGQSEADRRRMLDKQQRTFQLEIDGRYAKALKAYCDTGFGDERCFRPETVKPAYQAIVPLSPPVNPAPVSAATVPPPPTLQKTPASMQEVKELPAVAQISGFGDELAAILVFPGGKRMRVVGPGPDGPRSQLPGGEAVLSVRPGEVLVRRPGEGKPIALLFQAAAPSLGTSD